MCACILWCADTCMRASPSTTRGLFFPPPPPRPPLSTPAFNSCALAFSTAADRGFEVVWTNFFLFFGGTRAPQSGHYSPLLLAAYPASPRREALILAAHLASRRRAFCSVRGTERGSMGAQSSVDKSGGDDKVVFTGSSCPYCLSFSSFGPGVDGTLCSTCLAEGGEAEAGKPSARRYFN